jgi:alkanesulfonate monooxygenase SsuD/methylene tetrahydromethanopterin reductase-like flavin-dependent oxidoreductase (luciferase family)
LRFWVQSQIDPDRANWVDRAQRAESIGYDTFLMPDHFGRKFAIGPAVATVGG